MDIFIYILAPVVFLVYALLFRWGYECTVNGGYNIIIYLLNYYKFKKVNDDKTLDIQSSVKIFTFGVVIILLCLSILFIMVWGGCIRES
jgi:hypothetical protein